MPELGRILTLPVVRTDTRGIWLDCAGEEILLPRREAGETVAAGDLLAVALLREPDGSWRATLRLPVAEVGQFARLTVRTVTPHGAFLDWGMEKDLLAPFRHQPERMAAGRSYLVRIAADREGRPFASARLADWIEESSGDYTPGDTVPLVLWQFTDLGARVIVADRHVGLLYRDEITPRLKLGDRLTGFVKRVREDGKLDVTLRQVGAAGAEHDRFTLLAALQQHGSLPLHDDSPPEEIRARLGMSKKSFKKALGGLYKEGRLLIEEHGIRLKPTTDG